MNVLPAFLILALAAEPSEEEKKKYEEVARTAINATAAAIDGCTERYLEENPGTQGEAKISVTIVKGGVVSNAKVDTGLPQARSIRECLERIAKGWRLPEPQTDKPDDLSLKIPVRKGLKFKLYAPGEQRPPEAAAQPEGFLQFTPTFLPTYGDEGQK
jgi:hypothetical protein